MIPHVIVGPNTPIVYEGTGGRFIPCRYVPNWASREELGNGWVYVRVTKKGHGYTRGEIIRVTQRHVIPRKCLRFRKYSTAIVGTWEFTQPTHCM